MSTFNTNMFSDVTVLKTVFLLTLVATFIAAYLGRRHSKKHSEDSLSSHKLNKWLIGLSAGATANSGFIVTGAVGLGYTQGMQWIMLPLAWLLGDCVFWRLFPNKINERGRNAGASTISELLTYKLSGRLGKSISILTTLLILFCLGGYISAQWLAGQKFLNGAFELPEYTALLLFALLITAYTAIGGFRGSVYADSLQAIIRLLGTALALVAVIMVASKSGSEFWQNLEKTDENFLSLTANHSLVSLLGFVLGYAAAALGFGLGQPQIMSRYLAGSSPAETKAAWWIYIGFVQFTWLAMIIFGVILRGIVDDIPDPETGLSLFFSRYMPPILTGIIIADIFATLAATSNSLIIAMMQATLSEFRKTFSKNQYSAISTSLSIAIGLVTMFIASRIAPTHSVFDVAISSVSLLASGLAAPIIIRVMQWPCNAASILTTLIVGVSCSIAWKLSPFGQYMNEAAIGISTGLIINFFLTTRIIKKQERSKHGDS